MARSDVQSDVLYEVADDGVATLAFNRPEVLNALRRQTTDDVLEVLDDVLRQTEDHLEGVMSFVGRRQPRYQGR